MMNQIGNRADLQFVMRCELDQVRQTRHRTVVLHNFADDRRRRQTGKTAKITARFGMTGTHQHAAIACHDRENVSGLNNIVGERIRLNGSGNRFRTIGRRNACSHTFGRLNRYGEIGAGFSAIAVRHQRQVQATAALFSQGQTNEPTTIARHEMNRFRRYIVSR